MAAVHLNDLQDSLSICFPEVARLASLPKSILLAHAFDIDRDSGRVMLRFVHDFLPSYVEEFALQENAFTVHDSVLGGSCLINLPRQPDRRLAEQHIFQKHIALVADFPNDAAAKAINSVELSMVNVAMNIFFDRQI